MTFSCQLRRRQSYLRRQHLQRQYRQHQYRQLVHRQLERSLPRLAWPQQRLLLLPLRTTKQEYG